MACHPIVCCATFSTYSRYKISKLILVRIIRLEIKMFRIFKICLKLSSRRAIIDIAGAHACPARPASDGRRVRGIRWRARLRIR